MKILIIIPAYNEEGSIKRVVDNLEQNFPQYDYVVINDGSKDNTSKICHENGFNIIDLPTNLGLAGGFQTGMKYAMENDYDCAVQFDGDGQHRPEFIEPMVAKMQEGFDIVIASRFVTQKKPKTARMMGSNMISAAIKLTNHIKINDPTSGMRMFNKKLIRECALNDDFGPEPDTVSYMIRQGAKVAEVQATMDDRTEGESYLNFSTSTKYMLRMMISILLIQPFRKATKVFNEE
ncbi:MAG: glycosyltransferase family 2 protein [Lachnospiraceae bacterium]|nr:glycosyltransferase family 2 protein [Lachnospiraceae bacterium]